MKICYAFVLLFLVAQVSLAQPKVPTKKPSKSAKSTANDAPDLIGLITVNPDVIRGKTPIIAFIDVIETKKVPTSGTITVYVHKDTSFVKFEFNPTATSIENNKVHNANWHLDSTSNPNYYIFTSTKVIAGGALSTIGLTGIFSTSITGKSGISMSIVKGSGGEINSTNNTSSSAISYTP